MTSPAPGSRSARGPARLTVRPRPRPGLWGLAALPPLGLAAVLALQQHSGPSPSAPGPPVIAAPQVRPVRLPADAPRSFAEALAQIDREIGYAQARADQHADEWMVLESLARRQAARAKLTGDFEDYARAQATMDRAFAVARPGTGPHLSQAVLHFTLHRLAAAERQLDIIERYAVPPEVEVRAEVAALRGDIAFYRGDYAGARAAYARAEAVEPGSGGHFRQAVYASKTGDLQAAEKAFDRALAASRMPTPQFQASLELQKGTLDLERGRWDDALAHFRRADAIFPGWYLIEEHIAEALTRKGGTAEAEALYADIVRRTGNPEFMDALAGIAAARGDAATARSWRARAAVGWEGWLKMLPEAAYGHALGHFADSGDTARALDLARRNHAARPYGDAKVELASALLAAGEAETARTVIESVLASPWRTAQSHGVAAEVYAATGAARLAARERARALAINPHELDDASRPMRAPT